MHTLAKKATMAGLIGRLVQADRSLADLTDTNGRTPLSIAVKECKAAIQRALYFDGRYELDSGRPAHESATCLVVFATEHLTERQFEIAQQRAVEEAKRRATQSVPLQVLSAQQIKKVEDRVPKSRRETHLSQIFP